MQIHNILKPLDNSIKVEAFDENWNSVGIFDTIRSACFKLYIRRATQVYNYFGRKRGSKKHIQKRGVTSYKTGKKYHFKVIQNG